MSRKNQHEWGYVGFTQPAVGHNVPDVLFCGLCNRYRTNYSTIALSKKA